MNSSDFQKSTMTNLNDPKTSMDGCSTGGWNNYLDSRSNLPCGVVTYSHVNKSSSMDYEGKDSSGQKMLTPIALRSVDVIGIVVDCGIDLTVSQLYENRDSVTKEVYYVLPLSSDLSLYRFEYKVYSPSASSGPGSREGEPFRSLVIKKMEDMGGYSSMDHDGNDAFVLGDAFKAYLGAIRPFHLIQVRLAYVSMIKEMVQEGEEEASLLIDIPSVIFPNYGNMDEDSVSDPGDQMLWTGQQNQWFATYNDYPVKLFIRVYQMFACNFKLVTNLEEFTVRDSRGYRTRSELDTWYPYRIQATCLKSNALHGMKAKFSSTFELKQEARLILEHELEQSIGLLSLSCDKEPAEEAEVIFLLDQSGSMIGAPMKLAKAILLSFLRRLPGSVKFNVLGFGSDCDLFFKQSKISTVETLDQVRTFLENVDAVLGSSNLLRAMDFAKTKFGMNIEAKSIVIISDGNVEEMAKIKDYVRDELSTIRLNTVDVGGRDDKLGQFNLKCISTSGGGIFQVLREDADVSRCTNDIIPLFTQVPIEIEEIRFWSYMDNDLRVTFQPDMVISDHNKPVIYSGSRHNILVSFKDKKLKNSIGASVKLKGTLIEITGHKSAASFISNIGATRLFHRLWCRGLNAGIINGTLQHQVHDTDLMKYITNLQDFSSRLNMMSPYSYPTLMRNDKFQAESLWVIDTRFVGEPPLGKLKDVPKSKSKRRSRIFTPPLIDRELYGGEYSVPIIRELMLDRDICLKSSLQLPDGSFDLNKDFCSSLNMDFNYLSLSRKKSFSKHCWATCIAFVVLDNNLGVWSESEEEREQVIRRTNSWIKKHVTDEVDISECIHLALKVLWNFFGKKADDQQAKRQSYAHFYS